MAKDKGPIDARVVAVDHDVEPIMSVVVGDRRKVSLGRRLGLFAIFLLLLFFAISGYVQSSKNGHLLKRAAIDRSKLVASNYEITNSLEALMRDNRKQARQINRLQNALHKQNKILRANGLRTIVIPSTHSYQTKKPSSTNNKHKKKHHNTRHMKPSSSPTPQPSPAASVKNKTCQVTGVCLSVFREELVD